MTGRVFAASLKPAWDENKINEFLSKTKGDIIAFIINHDKDFDKNGELLETHTHIYLEYTNPRKVSTVANLLEVETNFVEVIRNKKGYLRYLTHMDEKEKHVYDASEVYTNSTQSYELTVRGNAMTDKEIAEWIKQGKGIELLGIVSASRLRTIQAFLHFDNSNYMLDELRLLTDRMGQILLVADNVEAYAKSAIDKIESGILSMSESFEIIANEMIKVRKLALRKES
jgi:quinol monooxygenase YgiN